MNLNIEGSDIGRIIHFWSKEFLDSFLILSLAIQLIKLKIHFKFIFFPQFDILY